MMYRKNLVVAVKVNGQVLRETSDRVELPFGSEYSILLKNLDTVRVQAKISIDGEDASGWLVLNPNSSMDVERFVKNLDRGNRFRFIERTDKVEAHRGVKAEDGLIRVEFKREKVYEAPATEHHTYHHHDYYDYYYWPYWNRPWYPTKPWYDPYITGLTGSQYSVNNSSLSQAQNCSGKITAQNCNLMREASVNDTGITVPGSVSEQKFVSVSDFATEASEVIMLHLVGKVGNAQIKTVKTVRTKLNCETCGKKNKSSVKFCAECGTSLERV
jgi:hypothetical protein